MAIYVGGFILVLGALGIPFCGNTGRSKAAESEKVCTFTVTPVKLEDTLSSKKKEITYRFTLSSTSRVQIRNYQGMTGGMITVGYQANDEVIGQLDTTKGTAWDHYLIAGDYRITVSNPTVKNGGSYGKYSFECSAASCNDTLEESLSANDSLTENAVPLKFDRDYRGTIAVNEPGSYSDIYVVTTDVAGQKVQIAVYSDSADLHFSLLGSSLTSKLYSTEIKSRNPHEELSAMDLTISLSTPGVHYLLLSTDGPESANADGSYQLRVERGYEYVSLASIHLLKGDSVPLLSEEDIKAAGTSDLNWENRAKGIFSVSDGMLHGDSHGYDVLIGRGVNEIGQLVEVSIPVTVEFTDVRYNSSGKNKYYYDAVYWAAAHGITAGVKDRDGEYRRFDPEGKCTRGQMISFLWRMAGCPEPKKITDYRDVKKEDYFYLAVSWAQETGITGGYPDGTFKPSNECTRAQAVAFLYRLEGQPEIESPTEFSDVASKEYYYKAVSWAQENSITGGYSDGTFKPQNVCSRGQMVTFLYRYYEKFS